MKLSGELDYRIRYDVEHDLFHAQNVFNDEYIKPTFIEYVQNLEKANAELKEQIEKMKCCGNCGNTRCTSKYRSNSAYNTQTDGFACADNEDWVMRIKEK